jgi:tRNA dimethylallyltransferase
MDIGTAKVTAADRARVPHHGLDLVEPDEPFSLADYVRHAQGALSAIAGRGGLAIIVGGTGLYLRAIATGLDPDADAADPAVRAAVESDLATLGLASLVGELRQRAPSAAERTDVENPRRVVRAVERARIAGNRPPPAPRGYPAPTAWIGLRLDPAEHRRRIAARAEVQFAGGLLDEAAGLVARYPRDLVAFSAMGYREAMAVVAGETDRDAAVARTITRTNTYAKRQRTWFRAEPQIEWLDGERLTSAVATARALVER